ncbi:MAG: TIGR02147 family protein [Bdellovibrionaceae bacterium]|nr:TIGR02147 family protein [Pseudobdellovibrionaceae bacterium]
MNLFEYTSYRDLIKDKIVSLKQLNSKYTFDGLAISMSIHKPYLSKVLNQKGNFTSDQLFKCCQYLKLTEIERHYFLALYEENTSTLQERKNVLNDTLEKIRRKALKSSSIYNEEESIANSLQMTNYFIDPHYPLIHMFLLIKKYRDDLDLISEKLNISKEKLSEYIENLHYLNIIEKRGRDIVVQKEFVRLPENSHMITAFRSLSKAKSLEKINQTSTDNYLSMHVFFTADENGRNKIQKLFLEFLEEAKKISDKSKTEDVLQLNFDLLKWT